MSSYKLNLSLNTLVKLYGVGRSKLEPEISKVFSQDGGFDYYNYASRAINYKIDKKDKSKIDDVFKSIKVPSAKEDNELIYNSFVTRFGSKRGLEFLDSSKTYNHSVSGVSVKFNPKFSHTSSSGVKIYHIWCPKTPEIDPDKYSFALYAIQLAYKNSNFDHVFYDGRKDKIYSKITSNTMSGTFDRFLLEVREIAEKIKH